MAKKGRKRPASELEKASLAQSSAAAAETGEDASLPEAVTPSTNKNEIRFGRHLASSDKHVRDRTVSALREWLYHRSKGGALTDLDLLKIWRGLWYCMFMCDKAPVQRELAQNLTSLMKLFSEKKEGVRFFRSFCQTMQRDWERIDNLRIDKYYTLVRLFVREAIGFCHTRPAAAPDVQSRVQAQAQAVSPPTGKRAKKKKKLPVSAPPPPTSDSVSAGTTIPLAHTGVATSRVDEGKESGWDLGLLRAVVTSVEEEILTVHPAPVGLRLHMADVWIEEACAAGGEDMSTEAFLVVLAPWLRAAAAPTTNVVVFKRTYDRVFRGLLAFFPRDGSEGEQEREEIFKRVDLARVQACVFEVAAAPQTREKRRARLYKLHQKYQKLTGVAPDMDAPPSGILPPPPKESSDCDEDNEELVEAGSRPRAVRGPEPPVPGWVAAGIAAGDISANGGSEDAAEDKDMKRENKSKKGKRERKRGADDPAKSSSGSDRGGGGGRPSSEGVLDRKGSAGENGDDGDKKPKREKNRTRKKGERAEEKERQEALVEESEESRDDAGGGGSGGRKNKKKKKNKGHVGVKVEVPAAAAREMKVGPETTTGAVPLDVADAPLAERGAEDSSVPSVTKKHKKRKKDNMAPPGAGTPRKLMDGDVEAARRLVEGDEQDRSTNGACSAPTLRPPASASSSPAPAPALSPTSPLSASPPASPSGERKKKRKRKHKDSQGDKDDIGVGVAGPADGGSAVAAMATAERAESGVEESSASPPSAREESKVTEEGKGRNREERGGEGTPPTQEQSAVKKKKKKRPKSTSPGAAQILSPSNNASPGSKPVLALRTPPKTGSNESTPDMTPGECGSGRKMVTFGVNTVKEHKVSVKDLKTRVITPSKESGTPEKGLLKSAGGSGGKLFKSSVGRKGTPSQRSKRASDFF